MCAHVTKRFLAERCVVASFACQARALSTVALAYMIRRRQGRAAREADEAAMHLNLQAVVVGAGLLANYFRGNIGSVRGRAWSHRGERFLGHGNAAGASVSSAPPI